MGYAREPYNAAVVNASAPMTILEHLNCINLLPFDKHRTKPPRHELKTLESFGMIFVL